ncbi:MAG TPA: glycoside hydrolase family 15 protein [Chloroflexia bacterium]|nr:glycoside hydrolase family 15 protein [Chloroflexia bacterium]
MTNNLFTHSIELIKANQTSEGAYLASPNFEQYRYCWFRDGAYIAYAMDLVGEHDSATRFYDWAVAMIASRASQVERAIAASAQGKTPAPEDVLHTRYSVDGQPAGNDWPNFQLDGFGTLLWGMSQHLAHTNRMPDAAPVAWREAIVLLVRYLDALWATPCYDCWEEFGDRVHTSTLAALYGGLQAAATMLTGEEGIAAWRTATLIKAFVLENGVRGGTLDKFVSNPAVDGSLLSAATPYGLFSLDSPLMRSTVERIEAELRRDGGGVHRYAEDSYYGGGEWVLLTAYLGWYYAEAGETDKAEALLERVAECANSEGELPEQVPQHLNYPSMLPVWEERWGKIATPLLWSHAAYLTLATHLNKR